MMKKINYYFRLLIRKAKIAFHNKFELKIKANEKTDIDNFLIFLWSFIFKNIHYSKNGHYFKTNITNKNEPMILSQIRVILILCNNYDQNETRFRNKVLIRSLTKYLLSMQGNDGLFSFNQVSWDLQDEGIASVWATMALVKSYEITGDSTSIDVAFLTMRSMLDKLYSKETGLVHTKGDTFWCLNAASTLAYVCRLLLEYKFEESIQIAMNESIELCISKIADDGHFPYNYFRQGTYLLLYHPIVIITLEYCLSSSYLVDSLREKLNTTLRLAKDFLVKSIDKNNRIFEPEIKHYSQYIITGVTSLLALKNYVPKNLENSLLENVSKFYKNENLYLCRDKNDFLYNSDLFSVKDVLTVEVLYWLDLYLNEKV
jgi:hypothetical protein